MRTRLVLAALGLWLGAGAAPVPLFGNSTLGYYFVNVYLGPQAEEQSLIFDTGSDATLVDCSLCVGCGAHVHARYALRYDNERNNPNGFHEFNCADASCQFSQSYSEGSTYYGTFVRDTVRLAPGQSSFEAVIGCVSAETGLFVTQDADGILGASPIRHGPGRWAKDPPSLLESALLEGRVPRDVLALCLAKDGGQLGFGESLDSLATSVPQRVSVTPETWAEFYMAPVRGLRAGTEVIPLDERGHLDSGTTLTYLPPAAHGRLLQLLTDACRSSRQCQANGMSAKCFGSVPSATDEDFLAAFPTLDVLFDAAAVSWRARDYFAHTESGQFCLLVEQGDSFLLGASFLTGKLVTFDRANFAVTFAEAECVPSGARGYRHRAALPTRFNHALNQIVAASEPARPADPSPGKFPLGVLLLCLGCVLLLVFLAVICRSRPRSPPYIPLTEAH